MLRKQLSYLLVTLLIGVIIGCGSSNPLVDEAESSFKNQSFESTLTTAEKSISEYPGDPLGYYYKGVALNGLASQEEKPFSRTEYYKKMIDTFKQAENVADTSEGSPKEIGRIPSVKNAVWRTEHNKGIQYIQSDSLKNTVDKPTKYAMQHLKNATIVQPDSALSWNVLAQVAAMDESFEKASSAKSKYLETIPDSKKKVNDYMQLAKYYYTQKKGQKVVETFERANEIFPENQKVISNLADAYNRVGQPDKAIETVRKLVEQNPENAKFHHVLGTQLYKKALKLSDSVDTNKEQIKKLKDEGNSGQKISELKAENEKFNPKVTKLTDQAEEEIKASLEYDSDNAPAYNMLGIIYQNRAKEKFDKRNMTSDNTEAKKFDEEGEEFLRKSMKYYEKATEIDPDNKEYWGSLFSIYTNLGMDKKAKKAMKKAGMD